MRTWARPLLMMVITLSVALSWGCTDPNVKQAKRYYKERNYDRAIEHYQRALEKNPDDTSVRYSLIEAYTQRLIEEPADDITPERVEGAMEELRPIAEPLMRDPSVRRHMSMVYQMMAKSYAEKGNDAKAAEAWEKVIELEPRTAEPHYNLGTALSRIGKYEEAVPHFEKSVSLNPYFIKGYYAAGNSLLRLNRPEEAITQYTKALELNPDDPNVHHDLGLAYLVKGEKEKAIEELEKTLEIEPGYVIAYRTLAGVYADVGESEKAEEAEEKWNEYVEALRDARRQQSETTASEEDME